MNRPNAQIIELLEQHFDWKIQKQHLIYAINLNVNFKTTQNIPHNVSEIVRLKLYNIIQTHLTFSA